MRGGRATARRAVKNGAEGAHAGNLYNGGAGSLVASGPDLLATRRCGANSTVIVILSSGQEVAPPRLRKYF
jgi:hypothetical protein